MNRSSVYSSLVLTIAGFSLGCSEGSIEAPAHRIEADSNPRTDAGPPDASTTRDGTPNPPESRAGCTSGVDCYCDLVRETGRLNDPLLLHCEDFEHPAFYEDLPAGEGSYWDDTGSAQNWRGRSSIWRERYGPPPTSCSWAQGAPETPKRGVPCTGGCGWAEYASISQGGGVEDIWDGNDRACFDVQREGDVNAEIPDLSLDRPVFDGRSHFAYRVQPRRAVTGAGRYYFEEPTNEIGMTMALAYSSNLDRISDSRWDGDFINMPWKHEEWGRGATHLFIGNTGGRSRPLAPAFQRDRDLPLSECQRIVGEANISVGSLECTDVSVRVQSDFDRSDEWPLGTWACIRGHISGLDSENGELHIWFNERLVFSATNLDFATLWRPVNRPIDHIWYNAYYNGNQARRGSDEPVGPNTEVFQRYMDNLHIRRGAPVSCAQIGFTTEVR